MENKYIDISNKLQKIKGNPLQLDEFVEKYILESLKSSELAPCLDFLVKQYLITQKKSMQYKLDYVTNLLNFHYRNIL